MVNDLLRIVRINEDVKRVVTSTRKINILALNAILLSRRAGKSAVGFAVISNELRIFSKDLAACMKHLIKLSHSSLSVVSHFQRYKRINTLWDHTQANSHHPAVTKPLNQSNEKLHQMQQELNTAYSALSRFMDDAESMGRFGSVIARSLKIEATYGGEFHSILAQIATEFSQYIDAIPEILNQAHHLLKKGH